MGPDFPTHYLMDTDTETVLEVLDDSAALRSWAGTRMMPKIRHYSILTPHSYYIRLQLIIPAGVNELDDAKYPLVIETNRLPGLQSVSYQNKLDWSRYLTSRREYITARVDTRGSAYQGDRHLYSVYQKLGEPELEDLKVALAYIKQLPYVDDSKIAVWGTEYGGYLATAMLASENQVACAVAVSPITSWKNYCKGCKQVQKGNLANHSLLTLHSVRLLGAVHGQAGGELSGVQADGAEQVRRGTARPQSAAGARHHRPARQHSAQYAADEESDRQWGPVPDTGKWGGWCGNRNRTS